MSTERRLLKIIRGITIFYILSLVFWGITAFPLLWELRIAYWFLEKTPDTLPVIFIDLKNWVIYVYHGLSETYANFPFLAYGTDWLAFSHLVIAVAFLGVYFKPIRNIWIVYFGMIACAGIIPLALICGHIRGIPFFWQMIDMSFGVFGIIPLIYLRKYIKKLEAVSGKQEYKY